MFLQPQHHHHHHPHTSVPSRAPPMDASSLARHSKRKAVDAPEGNERLSKRLSLLKLENGSTRLYVPVEGASSAARPDGAPVSSALAATPALASTALAGASVRTCQEPQTGGAMQVDDSKYKVYIYDIDKELASDDDGDDGEAAPGASIRATAQQTNGSGSGGAVVLLSDLDKHLRTTARDAALQTVVTTGGKLAVPQPVRANEDGELAGMQLVLYNDPSSLSVPREQDSVRMAILDARARIRARQREEQEEGEEEEEQRRARDDDGIMADEDAMVVGTPMATTPLPVEEGDDDDDDAMELD